MDLKNEMKFETSNSFEIESISTNTNSIKLSSHYSELIDKIGFNKPTWITFSIANLLQFLWGCETGLLSIYFESSTS